MSYDISLNDPVTGRMAEVPGHFMIGGTYKADYHPETHTFTPALNTEADLNVTYNYSRYYEEVYPENGIRTIYGLSGADSILVLSNMIEKLEEKYKKASEWITVKRQIQVAYDEKGNAIEDLLKAIESGIKYSWRDETVDWYEGPDSDYWRSTAANAIKPLYQLLALAKMRPDCIWDGD